MWVRLTTRCGCTREMRIPRTQLGLDIRVPMIDGWKWDAMAATGMFDPTETTTVTIREFTYYDYDAQIDTYIYREKVPVEPKRPDWPPAWVGW